jgi:RNA polymerase sigma-70 factor (ECF subfamily)
MLRDPDHAPARFPTTHASLILAVRQPEFRAEALEAILETYWKPVYKYGRLKWNRSPEDAQDLTQGFFASLLERDLLSRWDPTRASFRAYLRLCFDGYAKNELTAANRLKRGGTVKTVSLDFEAAERELPLAAPQASPEELFHREWQRRMFELAIADLARYCQATGHLTQWRIFARFDLAAAERPSYDQLAAEHSLPVTTITNYLAWARRQLRRALLDRLARTTSGGPELRREARDLLSGHQL